MALTVLVCLVCKPGYTVSDDIDLSNQEMWDINISAIAC